MDEDIKNLSRSEVSEMLFNKNGIYKDIYYCARKIKGTSEYMKTKQRNLTAMIDQEGLPSFFLTFSYANTYWDDL